MTVDRRFLYCTLLVTLVVPPLITVLLMWILSGLQYVPGTVLAGLSVSEALPFVLLWLLARSDLSDAQRVGASRVAVFARLSAAWIPMLVLATAVDLAAEWSTYKNFPGSSTNPIAVFALPVVLIGVGISCYVLVWIGSWLVKRLRSGN